MTGAYICPIYDKDSDFDFGYKLVESAIRCHTVDVLFFVFSFKRHEEKFLQNCKNKFGKVPGSILFDNPLEGCKNPVSIKKWYGVKALKSQFDYVATIDCECIFLKPQNTGDVLEDVWNTRSFLNCNYSLISGTHIKKCAFALGLDNNEILLRETRNFSVTWWFNEIPVYKCDNVDEFFEWLNNENRFEKSYYEWYCFDYYVYVMWLLTYKKMALTILPYKSVYGIIECLCNSFSLRKTKIEKAFKTHWTSREGKLNNNSMLCLQFHRDRSKKSLLDKVLYTIPTYIYALKISNIQRRTD